MKKALFFGLATLFSFQMMAQVSLEHTYNYSATVVKFETIGYKYYLMDVPRAECRIYNMDHSLYKTISCPVPSGCYVFDIKFLSEKTFDSDAGIELLYSWYKYYSGSDYYDYDSRIINEDGTEIAQIDGALYNYINKTGEDTYHLFSYCYDFSVFPEIIWTKIFSLPGQPVQAALMDENPDNFLKAFPNPAASNVKVEYRLPDQVESGILHLIDSKGSMVSQFKVDTHTHHLLLNVAGMKSGVYHYFIEYDNTRTPSKKLVINQP